MIRAFGRDIPETTEDILAARSALLVWDLQECIAGRVPDRQRIVAGIHRLLDAAHAAGVLVMYSQHYSLPLAAEDTAWIRAQWLRSGLRSPEELAPLATPGSDAWKFLPDLEPGPEDVVVPKTRPDLFVGTPARDILAAQNIQTLVLTGVTTDRGIVATARHATHVGLLPVVVVDAVGSYTEEAHQQGLRASAEVATMSTVDEVALQWESQSSGGGRAG